MAATVGRGDQAFGEGEFENADDFDILQGPWVAPFAGHIHCDPGSGPALAAYRANGASFTQVAGYWPSAGLITLFFDGHGGIDGDVHINRGGAVGAFPVSGSYRLRMDSVRWINGELNLKIPGPGGIVIDRGFKFLLRDLDHMEWVMLTATKETDPATSILTVITSGTFTRVSNTAT